MWSFQMFPLIWSQALSKDRICSLISMSSLSSLSLPPWDQPSSSMSVCDLFVFLIQYRTFQLENCKTVQCGLKLYNAIVAGVLVLQGIVGQFRLFFHPIGNCWPCFFIQLQNILVLQQRRQIMYFYNRELWSKSGGLYLKLMA